MDKLQTVEINIFGIVQAVGFRPFLFNLARKFNLKGYILNRGNAGVRLVLQGKVDNITQFMKNLETRTPKIAFIENIDIKQLESKIEYNTLEIKRSEEGRGISLSLPPDISICEDCIQDMRNKSLKKYYNYPFIACAVCGPRYTTVKELPYDRERTTMVEFPFCKEAEPESCLEEYSNFDNRRFHAQTFACKVCGPSYTLYDKFKKPLNFNTIEEILQKSAKIINNGEILAVKGIGGVHLVCLANDDDVLLKLRQRKGDRKNKPFAVMIPDLEFIEDYFIISEKEREILTSFRKPIVLLERKKLRSNSLFSEYIAPGLNNIGIMLPYSGIHYLLFDHVGKKPLVYTSGNPSNLPMGIDNEVIFNQLQNLADYYILHNRPIYQRADDSVLRMHNDIVKLIRRSRGYVPEYLPLPFEVDIPGALAVGPELTVTGALLRRNRIFPTQHIGNVNNLEIYEFLKDAVFHIKNLLQIKDEEIKFIASDLHPAFTTTKLAKELTAQFNVELFQIQHHYAHALSLMAENKVRKDEGTITICTDGVGYGEDGNVWGGEILLTSYKEYQRLGHLKYQPMIGGDRCTKYPARMAASIILNSVGIDEAKLLFNQLKLESHLEYGKVELNSIISQYTNSNQVFPTRNIPISSSTGRIFDTVSYLLGVSEFKSYQGEPAMRLEGFASSGNPDNVNLDIKTSKKNGFYIIDTSELILEIISLLENDRYKKQDIAAAFQTQLAKTFAFIALESAKKHDIRKIGLSGGTAYNYTFSNTIKKEVLRNGYTFLEHNIIPPGDAGVSTGQLIGGLFQYLDTTD
ncbi:MAG: carbamoyltransferase HypF [Candidatus Hermodarchaeota archaeon]